MFFFCSQLSIFASIILSLFILSTSLFHHQGKVPTTPKEIFKEIKKNSNLEKAPGYGLITGEILKQLPKKKQLSIKLSYITDAAFGLKYVLSVWKIAPH
jgi:hypothetical protein